LELIGKDAAQCVELVGSGFVVRVHSCYFLVTL
jgi:hypothetical protein